METEKNYYEVLGINNEASSSEIKKAFYKLLPQYPPEQKPEEFKVLRKAYDVLSNPTSRKEYDNMSKYGGEIENLKTQAQQILNGENPDYEAVIRILKKAVVLGPEIGMLRNMLGEAYLCTENFEDSLKQFEKSIAIDPKNNSYSLNKAYALSKLKRYPEAEQLLYRIWKNDPEDNAAPRQLAQIFYDTERKEMAYETLEKAISGDGIVDFKDFGCIYDLLHFYMFDNKKAKLNYELKRIVEIAVNPSDKKFASFMLAKVGYELSDMKIFDISSKFLKAATQLDSENEELKDFTKSVTDAKKMQKHFNEIKENSSIHPAVVELLRISVGRWLGYFEENTEEEIKKEFTEALDFVDTVLEFVPDGIQVQNSVKYIRSNYPNSFPNMDEIFDAILSSNKATKFTSKCPYCNTSFWVERYNYGNFNCPHCNGYVHYDGNRYTKTTYSSSNSSSSGDCFVATATYGTPLAPEVQIFREFRDNVLLKNNKGKLFVKWYYKYGPYLANIVKKSKLVKMISNNILNYLLKKIKIKLNHNH